MRLSLALMFLVFSNFAFGASNNCEKYSGQDRYMKAIQTVAQELEISLEELCTLPRVMDIEAQPSRLISRDGEIIPHVRVQLHMAYESCLYMVRDSDQTVSQQRCYSGF